MSIQGRDRGAVERRSGSALAPLLAIALLVLILGGAAFWFLRVYQADKADKADKAEDTTVAAAPTAPEREAKPAAEPEPEPAPAVAAKPDPPPQPAPAPARPAEPPPPAKEAEMTDPIRDMQSADAALERGDVAEAVRLLDRLAEAGVAAAQRRLGLMLAKGEQATADPKRAFELFQAAAMQLDADAQFYLGHAYLDGLGTKADQVMALAWFMVAAAYGHAGAAEERDRGYAALDAGGQVRAESKSRDLDIPFPAGWLADDASGVEVWSPSWYRNGTVKVKVDVPAVDGKAHGTGRVSLDATLYGRSDNYYEGTFRHGLLLDDGVEAPPDDLLITNEALYRLDPADTNMAAVKALWAQFEIDGMRIPRCPKGHVALFPVLAAGWTELEDQAMQAVAVAAIRALEKRCPLADHLQVRVYLLYEDYRARLHRGDTLYEPQRAEVYVYVNVGTQQDPTGWNFQVKNYAKREHEARLRQEEEAREKREREEKQARELAAAAAREIPDIRGFKLGLTFEAFREALGDDAETWTPPLRADHRMPDFADLEQKVKLRDGSTFTAVFASSQNGSRLMVLVYEQHLRDGPTLEELRQQLYGKYGQPDDEAGGRTWLTWWLRSGFDDEPKGAFLRGRITSARDGKADYLRLVLNDYNLVRHDERVRVQARRQAEIDKFEKGKSDEVKF